MTSSALYEELKTLILEVADDNERIGQLQETLKWDTPSFAPVKKNIGSSVRLSDREDGSVGMYFICTTKLVNEFQEIYPDAFDYRDGRALIFQPAQSYDRDALKHCVGMALTNKIRKR